MGIFSVSWICLVVCLRLVIFGRVGGLVLVVFVFFRSVVSVESVILFCGFNGSVGR